MPNQKNKEQVFALKDKISKAKSIVFTDYKGLNSNQANELRRKLSEEGSEIEIAKNTLLKIALKVSGYEIKEVEKTFEGSTAAILSYSDPISPLKKLFEFIKTAGLPKVKLGIFDGGFLPESDVETLSKLPSKEVLVSKLLSTFNSPIFGFVNVLSGTKRKFVYALNEITKKKGGAAS